MCIDTSIRWVVMSVYYIVDVNPLYTLIQSPERSFRQLLLFSPQAWANV